MTSPPKRFRIEGLGFAAAALDAGVRADHGGPQPDRESMERIATRAVVQAGHGLSRVAEELAAASADVGRGVQAILALFEEIDAVVHRLAQSGALTPDGAALISDRVMAVFQACDFQDLAGQHMASARRVVTDLDRKIVVLRRAAGLAGEVTPIEPELEPEHGWPVLENGPRLAADETRMTQVQIDRLMHA
ncbi:MAG: hypothetical protein ACOYOJ_07680 [Alsobacter sp.]